MADDQRSGPPGWLALLAGGMAGGMGWGIRGQYGHETGAMMAGVLIGLVAVLLYLPRSTSLRAARAVALCVLGISLGGSMTYGQTVGLTHDPALVGNWAALRWGLIGLFIKGGTWIGFAGVFLAMGLSEKKYRPHEMALLLICLLFVTFLGIWYFNTPFDPANRVLPRFYFSDDWFWEPDGDLKPRPEVWGGLLSALVCLWIYAGLARGDRLVRRLGVIAFLSGGFGFSIGQCVQAQHAWNPNLFDAGPLASIAPYMNWWNMMEITFGTIAGAGLVLGVKWNRSLIAPPETADDVELPVQAEWLLALVYTALLVEAEFGSFGPIRPFVGHFLVVALLPFICVTAGRIWPYLVTLPFLALPICGKTFRNLCVEQGLYEKNFAAAVFLAVPLTLMLLAAVLLSRKATQPRTSRSFARIGLLLTAWLYFWLNFAFFHFPWPWGEWTGRTPSGIIFTICLVGLTLTALFCRGSPLTADSTTRN